MGIVVIAAIMVEAISVVQYERKDMQNILTMIKKL